MITKKISLKNIFKLFEKRYSEDYIFFLRHDYYERWKEKKIRLSIWKEKTIIPAWTGRPTQQYYAWQHQEKEVDDLEKKYQLINFICEIRGGCPFHSGSLSEKDLEKIKEAYFKVNKEI